MKLPIHERFHSFQGEGSHRGRSAFFIRTFGCPVHCPWCDSAGTWHPDYVPDPIERFECEALAAEAASSGAEFTVITGGEPAIHDLRPLTDALSKAGQPAHLETSGGFPVRGTFAWITLSPKRWKPPISETLARANEFKIIVDGPGAIKENLELIGDPGDRPVWLHPEWSKREDPEVLNAITDWVKTRGAPFRAGWQIHRNYAADTADVRSAAAAPLGGDITNGF